MRSALPDGNAGLARPALPKGTRPSIGGPCASVASSDIVQVAAKYTPANAIEATTAHTAANS